jgi:hypothetical protein
MSKKVIIITGAAGLVSFAGAFMFAWLTRPAPASRGDESEQATPIRQQAESEPSQTEAIAAGPVGAGGSAKKTTMTEDQLENLAYEIREKMQEYNDKLKALEVQEQRLRLSQETLKRDIEELNNLRVELASIVAGLKEQRDKLMKSKLEVAQAEKANLVAIAAAYDKMDSASASKILISMCGGEAAGGRGVGAGETIDDAVKILNYMTERPKAKLLAELVNAEPKLAAALCQRLKELVER